MSDRENYDTNDPMLRKDTISLHYFDGMVQEQIEGYGHTYLREEGEIVVGLKNTILLLQDNLRRCREQQERNRKSQGGVGPAR